jgi:hypothetical protein
MHTNHPKKTAHLAAHECPRLREMKNMVLFLSDIYAPKQPSRKAVEKSEARTRASHPLTKSASRSSEAAPPRG